MIQYPEQKNLNNEIKNHDFDLSEGNQIKSHGSHYESINEELKLNLKLKLGKELVNEKDMKNENESDLKFQQNDSEELKKEHGENEEGLKYLFEAEENVNFIQNINLKNELNNLLAQIQVKENSFVSQRDTLLAKIKSIEDEISAFGIEPVEN